MSGPAEVNLSVTQEVLFIAIAVALCVVVGFVAALSGSTKASDRRTSLGGLMPFLWQGTLGGAIVALLLATHGVGLSPEFWQALWGVGDVVVCIFALPRGRRCLLNLHRDAERRWLRGPKCAEHPVGFRGCQVLRSGRNPEQSTRIQLIRPSRSA